MNPASSLLAKILSWFFLNMVLVAVALALFFAFQSHLDLHAIFGQQATNRLMSAGTLIAQDLNKTPGRTGLTFFPDMQRSIAWISLLCSETDPTSLRQTVICRQRSWPGP